MSSISEDRIRRVSSGLFRFFGVPSYPCLAPVVLSSCTVCSMGLLFGMCPFWFLGRFFMPVVSRLMTSVVFRVVVFCAPRLFFASLLVFSAVLVH